MTKQQRLQRSIACACLGTALLFWQPAVLQAEEAQEEYSLDQVVVTATKTPVKEFEANANITVITREELENNHYHDLAEALRNVPGVSIRTYGSGVGYEQSNTLRINGSDKVVVLVDGVRVNVAGVNFPASAYAALNNVERIEVLKGSASALYGSDAKGGVINIITRKATSNKSSLSITGGSYNTENYSFTNQGRAGEYSWLVTSQKDILGNAKDAHGLEIPQHSNRQTDTFKLTKKINDGSDITFSYDRYQADGVYSGSNYHLTERHKYTNDNYNWKMIYNAQLSPVAKNQFSFFNSMYDTAYDIGGTYPNNTYVRTIGIQDQYTQTLGAHVMVAGFDFNQDKVMTAHNVKLTNRALYLQDEWKMDDQWNLTTGVRSDWHSGYDNRITPRITVGYKQDSNTNYYLSYNEYFIAPTPTQLYSSFYGNNHLQPEDGKNLEAGVNHRFDDTLTATFHVFRREATNAVGWVHTGPGLWDGTYQNFDEKANGWDVQFNKKLSKQMNAYAGYTYTNVDPTKERAENVDGYVPKGAWNIGLGYHQERYNIALEGQGIIHRVGPQTEDASPTFFPKTSYWVWNMSVNYKVQNNMTAFVRINNLFDTFYAEQSNARSNWGGAVDEWWTSPGRNYQFGLKYTI